ncbi:protein LvrD [Fluoribacter dumoffii]|uniref:T4SS-associated protein LvrD n=1 Tax=Fluoribacter dumoffii TaxID=463 RepID=UPI002243D787|nr:T4SS-associated protein LvrD [Fluoribacter dumoffii]MCW8452967.1 protein LvrD [Fluoribacter dumoffii]MCW8483172.1 protein LvrD [Fluoribacter dumoffii]
MNKLLSSCIMILGALTLCACHHENPLKTHLKKDTLNFLMNASANVEKRLHFPTQKDSYGYAYLECMEGTKNPELQCGALYNKMVSFAKEGHYQDFKNLNIKDLTDSAFFIALADDYAEFAGTHEPRFISEAH